MVKIKEASVTKAFTAEVIRTANTGCVLDSVMENGFFQTKNYILYTLKWYIKSSFEPCISNCWVIHCWLKLVQNFYTADWSWFTLLIEVGSKHCWLKLVQNFQYIFTLVQKCLVSCKKNMFSKCFIKSFHLWKKKPNRLSICLKHV